jgi:hypothetical protein
MKADSFTKPGDSVEQRLAGTAMLQALSTRLGMELRPMNIALPGGGTMPIEGATDDLSVICEAWSHQGSAKSAQRSKVMADAMKLVYGRELLRPRMPRTILVFSDEEAAADFRGNTWRAQALQHFGIVIETVEIPKAIREAVRVAQVRQFR